MPITLVNLNDEEEIKVLKSVGYSQSQLSQDLTTLRQWLDSQEHLPLCRLKEKDEFLINYLVGCKGSLEKCKRKLDNYYTLRRNSVIFAVRDPKIECIARSRKNVLLAVMPTCLPDGYRLSVFKLLMSDGFDALAVCRRLTTLMEIRLRWPISAGDTVIIDCSDFNSSYLPGLNPSMTKETLDYMQDALPLRCSQYFFINCSSLVETVVNKMIRPFLRTRMAERFTVTSEGTSFLHKVFSKDVLPSDYDGLGPSLEDCEDMLNTVGNIYGGNNNDFVKNLLELTDESKRPKVSPYLVDNDIFGVQGTIKSLDID